MLEEEERRGEHLVDDGREALPALKWVELADHGQTRAAIIEYVRLADHVTFDALMLDFHAYGETSGEFGLALRADTRIVVWTRMSREMADVISELIAAKRLYLNQVDSERYRDSAQRPKLAVIDSVPENKVDAPCWLPVTLRLVPPPGGSRRLARVVRIRLGRSSA